VSGGVHDVVLHVGVFEAGSWGGVKVSLAQDGGGVGGVRSGDLSLLSSVPGRPRRSEGGEGWNLGGLKGFGTASEWRAVAVTYMYGGLGGLGMGPSRG
jgi:hypothetical protein